MTSLSTICGNEKICAVATADGLLLTYAMSGRRLLADISLGCNVVRMCCASESQACLMVLTTNGDVRVWNFQCQCCVTRCSVAGALSSERCRGGRIVRVADIVLTSNLVPVVFILSQTEGGDVRSTRVAALIYHNAMQTWLRVDVSLFELAYQIPILMGNMKITLGCLGEIASRARALLLDAGVTTSGIAIKMVQMADERRDIASLRKRSAIEVCLNVAKVLQSENEYWLLAQIFARHLVNSYDFARIRVLCSSILSTSDSTVQGCSMNDRKIFISENILKPLARLHSVTPTKTALVAHIQDVIGQSIYTVNNPRSAGEAFPL